MKMYQNKINNNRRIKGNKINMKIVCALVLILITITSFSSDLESAYVEIPIIEEFEYVDFEYNVMYLLDFTVEDFLTKMIFIRQPKPEKQNEKE